MKEKWTPHIIAVVGLVVFIVLGLGSASANTTSQEYSKFENPGDRIITDFIPSGSPLEGFARVYVDEIRLERFNGVAIVGLGTGKDTSYFMNTIVLLSPGEYTVGVATGFDRTLAYNTRLPITVEAGVNYRLNKSGIGGADRISFFIEPLDEPRLQNESYINHLEQIRRLIEAELSAFQAR